MDVFCQQKLYFQINSNHIADYKTRMGKTNEWKDDNCSIDQILIVTNIILFE